MKFSCEMNTNRITIKEKSLKFYRKWHLISFENSVKKELLFQMKRSWSSASEMHIKFSFIEYKKNKAHKQKEKEYTKLQTTHILLLFCFDFCLYMSFNLAFNLNIFLINLACTMGPFWLAFV